MKLPWAATQRRVVPERRQWIGGAVAGAGMGLSIFQGWRLAAWLTASRPPVIANSLVLSAVLLMALGVLIGGALAVALTRRCQCRRATRLPDDHTSCRGITVDGEATRLDK